MNLSLTPDCEQLIRKKVESGMYLSPEEVVREALHLLDQRDRFHEFQLEELRKEIQIGIDQADRGELLEGEAVFDRLEEKLRAKAGQGS